MQTSCIRSDLSANWVSTTSLVVAPSLYSSTSLIFVISSLFSDKCDQIGRFMKVFGDIFHKSCPNKCWLFGLLWKTFFLNKNGCGNFWATWGKIFISTSGHTAVFSYISLSLSFLLQLSLTLFLIFCPSIVSGTEGPHEHVADWPPNRRSIPSLHFETGFMTPRLLLLQLTLWPLHQQPQQKLDVWHVLTMASVTTTTATVTAHVKTANSKVK